MNEQHIFTADDLAKKSGFDSYRAMLMAAGWSGQIANDQPALQAKIDWGRLLVDCPDCNSAEMVTPSEPVFFCRTCENIRFAGKAIPVEFPSNLAEIEQALLKRPAAEDSLSWVPLIAGFLRNWKPGQTMDDLLVQNKARGC